MVDGVPTLDPNNVYVFRDFATVSNVFIVGNGQADLYEVQEVPHGTLSHRWYKSEGLKKHAVSMSTHLPVTRNRVTKSIPYSTCCTEWAVMKTNG